VLRAVAFRGRARDLDRDEDEEWLSKRMTASAGSGSGRSRGGKEGQRGGEAGEKVLTGSGAQTQLLSASAVVREEREACLDQEKCLD
jgi:hypothetical protein